MRFPSLIWGAPEWLTSAIVLLGVAFVALLYAYTRPGTQRAKRSVRIIASALKAVGFAVVVISLLEPLLTGSRPRRGANSFVILADNSQSLLIKDDGSEKNRGEWVRDLLKKETPWRTRLGQDFDVRAYAFDSHLRAVSGFETMPFDGTGTALGSALAALSKRFRGLPLAGVLLVTDGNKTDPGVVDFASLPPIYPVIPHGNGVARDIGLSALSVSQTNFETAPVVIRADVSVIGFPDTTIVAVVKDEEGKEIERQEVRSPAKGKPLSFRFQFRPEKKGVSFYQVSAAVKQEAQKKLDGADAVATSTEQTLANNTRLAVVDRGEGPYRILYVSGRPNWEFKFLRRALAEDEQVELVGLVRIARRQPKFDFRDSRARSNSTLFEGFDHPDADSAERVDQPVLVRLGTRDEEELRDGFPKTADELYRYYAIIVDDIEAGFFTQDQLSLIRNFVSQRGGGLLMLGGPDSFADGKYDRTPVGELLPVYLNRDASSVPPVEQECRLVLTREGWLQPWVRTRKTEDEERLRLAAMPAFKTLSHAGAVKPGAVVLAEVTDVAGTTSPALVAQQFGKGRVAAIMIGDLWRWGLRREDLAESDLDKSWRQTVRWLVADVPSHVEIDARPKANSSSPAIDLTVRVRDPEYRPLDNAKASLRIALPDGEFLTLEAEPDGREPGTYHATYVPKLPGAYRVVASATAPDGSPLGERQAGWASQPAADEFANLAPDREFLKTLAARTKGEVIEGENLAAFVAGLSSRDAPINEPWTSPLWHHPIYFLIAIACLAGEWGLRRINGLA